MHFYRKHYKLTSLILLSVTLACLGYVQERMFEQLDLFLNKSTSSQVQEIKTGNSDVKTFPNIKCYYLIAKKALLEY